MGDPAIARRSPESPVSTRAPRLGRAARRGLAEAPQRSGDTRWGPLRGARQLLVALSAPIDDATVHAAKAALLRHGGWVSSYLPDSALLCIGGAAAADAPTLYWLLPGAPLACSSSGKKVLAGLCHGMRVLSGRNLLQSILRGQGGACRQLELPGAGHRRRGQ